MVHIPFLPVSLSFHRNSTCRQLGVSLFDALVTVFVIATLTTVGIPSFKEMLVRNEQVTAINALITALHLARSEAIKRVTRVGLCPSRDGQECMDAGGNGAEWHFGYLVYVDQNGNRAHDNQEPVVHRFDAQSRIRIYTPQSRDHVTYQANGFASGTNATFLFCDPAKTVPARSVILSNTGRPRVAPSSEACPADTS